MAMFGIDMNKHVLKTRLSRWRAGAMHLMAPHDLHDLRHLRSRVIELKDIGELRKAFGWKREPILDDPEIHQYDHIEDINERRLRDAESLGTVVCNVGRDACLEIGTSNGHATALMALNAPQSHVWTVNIAPEEILSGEGGVHTTIALAREEIGRYYRERELTNITQIFANTAHWTPDIGAIDVAFIDGCHDTEFVYNDTRKVLGAMKPGSFVLWHDFNLQGATRHQWIRCVCLGIEKLIADGLVHGPIFHVRDSWIGIYRIPDNG